MDEPITLVGQARGGAEHTLFVHKPYRQFEPVVQAEPRAPPVLVPVVVAEAL